MCALLPPGVRGSAPAKPEAFACPDVNRRQGALAGRVKITEQKKMC